MNYMNYLTLNSAYSSWNLLSEFCEAAAGIESAEMVRLLTFHIQLLCKQQIDVGSRSFPPCTFCKWHRSVISQLWKEFVSQIMLNSKAHTLLHLERESSQLWGKLVLLQTKYVFVYVSDLDVKIQFWHNYNYISFKGYIQTIGKVSWAISVSWQSDYEELCL